jgi:hypothetical protein
MIAALGERIAVAYLVEFAVDIHKSHFENHIAANS